jgi:UDP-N-acetylglucosamine 4,6-dehydratase
MHNVDYVVHAAALKQVDTAEYNPFEYVQTNIIGTQNVIEAAIDTGVKKVVALSTDKASSPINLYGATKLAADKLCQSANHYAAGYETRFSVVRYGNVMGSRGSVVPFWKQLASEGKEIPITDSRMTRFWISLPEAVKFVVEAFYLMHGGEVFVPRIPSMKIIDLAEAVAPGVKTVEIGIRPGEKLHEEMIAADDSRRTISFHGRYVILPTIAKWSYEPLNGDPVEEGFAYRSDSNDKWLSVEEIRNLLKD